MALTTEQIEAEAFVRWGDMKGGPLDLCRDFARAIEAEVRNSALEEAATAVESATYRKRWARASINGQANNVPPCELAAAIRALKESPPPTA